MEEEKTITNLNQSHHDHNEIRRLLEKNIELSQQVLRFSKKINNFVIQQRIFFVLKILIIVIPLILGIIYLPPLYAELMDVFNELRGLGGAVPDFGIGGLLN